MINSASVAAAFWFLVAVREFTAKASMPWKAWSCTFLLLIVTVGYGATAKSSPRIFLMFAASHGPSRVAAALPDFSWFSALEVCITFLFCFC
ncbi:Uncharacterised protein [Mycobacteroides abscessus subsp. abscessus]|nr:Uncharacterised protein [Mycobacteroides abscessus subsp. abscessus]